MTAIVTPTELLQSIIDGSAARDGRVRLVDGEERVRFDAIEFSRKGNIGIVTFLFGKHVQGHVEVPIPLGERGTFGMTFPLVCETPLELITKPLS